MASLWFYIIWITHASVLAQNLNATKDIRIKRFTIDNLDTRRTLKFRDTSTDGVIEVKIPNNCTHDICEHVENYPYELVRRAVKKIGLNTIRELGDPIPANVTRRLGNEFQDMCPSQRKYMHPQAVKHNGIWEIVVNFLDQPLQGFEVSLCANGASCSNLLTVGYEGYCEQAVVPRMMFVVRPNGKVTQGLYNTPVNCACKVKPK